MSLRSENTLYHCPRPPPSVCRYLTAGGAVKTVAESYRVAPCTATGIVHEVCESIYNRLAPLYLRSPTLDDWKAAAADFEQDWHLPNCIGALDGKHVALQKPADTGTLYYNYKGFCSVVLLAIADARYRCDKLHMRSYMDVPIHDN